MIKMKTCTKCKESYPASLEYFYQDLRNKNGLMSACKECLKQESKQYRLQHQEQIRKRKKIHNKQFPNIRRGYKFKNLYGITFDQYNLMFEKQNGCCAICGKSESEFKKRLYVDHGHETGKVRGLLCCNCNFKLSVIEDKEFFEKANSYLKKGK